MNLTIYNNDGFHLRYEAIAGSFARFVTSFPDVAAIAEFRPWSQTVHLHHVGADSLRESLLNKRLDLCRAGWQTIAHELTHWIDLVGTVWGRDYLLSLANAYMAAMGGDETRFGPLVDHFDDDRRILFPLYYHVVAERPSRHSTDRPWSIEYTSGYEFSCDGRINEARPIFFAVFGENPTRRRIARQPLSVGALLETRAIFSEIVTGLQIISDTKEESSIVESVIFGKELTELLYSPEFTTYTAPVHVLSARSHTRDPVLSYDLGSELAFISLNLTDELILRLHHPEGFRPFAGRRDAFIRNKDRGYIFATLAFHAPEYTGQSQTDYIERTLKAAGLPGKEEIYRHARSRIDEAVQLDGDQPPIRVIKSLLGLGPQVFDALSNGERPVVDLNMLFGHADVFPFMYDKDGDLFSLTGESPGMHDANEMLEAEYSLREFLQNFLPACRGSLMR